MGLPKKYTTTTLTMNDHSVNIFLQKTTKNSVRTTVKCP